MNIKPVYIVAGGPSLIDFDFTSLSDKDVIAINNAAFRLPNAKYVYFCNKDWFEMWKDKLRVHSGCIIQGEFDHVAEDWVEKWIFGEERLCLARRTIHPGGNSGYAAINLAVQLGYKEIYLLGYDMKWTGDNHNWHNDHTRWISKDGFDSMLDTFTCLVEPLKKLGVQVYNLNPDSNLKVFPVKLDIMNNR